MSIYSNLVQQLAGVGGIEWIIIIIIFLALIFGSKKLPEVARGIGKAASEFEKTKNSNEERDGNGKDSKSRHSSKSEPGQRKT